MSDDVLKAIRQAVARLALGDTLDSRFDSAQVERSEDGHYLTVEFHDPAWDFVRGFEIMADGLFPDVHVSSQGQDWYLAQVSMQSVTDLTTLTFTDKPEPQA